MAQKKAVAAGDSEIEMESVSEAGPLGEAATRSRRGEASSAARQTSTAAVGISLRYDTKVIEPVGEPRNTT